MNITQTFIGNLCGESSSNHVCCCVSMAIVVLGLLICLTTWMIINYLKGKQKREDDIEKCMLAYKDKIDKCACIADNMYEICKVLKEIKSKMETRSK